ncbi:hypothetical protein B0H14DRAFT_341509 [Mycena olivaceomarginata]|nr:hypothetical protein B0H14DRAFT_341509 [Mycena olivaceomarginata]
MSAATNATTSIPSAPGCLGQQRERGVGLLLPLRRRPPCAARQLHSRLRIQHRLAIHRRHRIDIRRQLDHRPLVQLHRVALQRHRGRHHSRTLDVSNSQSQIATVTSKPESTASATGTSGAEDLLVFQRQGHLGRGILAGIVMAGGLLHILSLAI